MTPERLDLISAVLTAEDPAPVLVRLLDVAVSMLPVDGAAIAIISDGEHQGAVAVTSAMVTGVDELQFSLGEGPCIDTSRSGAPVLRPDLEQSSSDWPVFVREAASLGVQSAFSFPMSVGAIDVGVLSFYARNPTDLSGADLADAFSIVRIATHLFLDLEDDAGPEGIPNRLDDVLHHRREVHQATGMVSAQLDVSPAAALARLRAHACAHGRVLHEVALDVVNLVLRFEP